MLDISSIWDPNEVQPTKNISNDWINTAKRQLCCTVRTENKDLGSDPVSILPDTSVAESAVKCSLVPVNLPAFMRLIIVKQ